MRRILEYAKLLGYTKYTSTLEEAWAASISGLSAAFVDALHISSGISDIEVDHDFSNDPISSFGVIEAQRHRGRGITMKSFLSLMKYYRQSYHDLIDEKFSDPQKLPLYHQWINRFFDHNEIAFTIEWTGLSQNAINDELQTTNIKLTNEKNKYLTIFESSPNPSFLIDTEHHCINMNFAALQMLQKEAHSPGLIYYSTQETPKTIKDVMPWLYDDYIKFVESHEPEMRIEKEFSSPTMGHRIVQVILRKMLDVSSKYDGTIIIFNDLTDYKTIEQKLRYISFHDKLTGLYNRTYLEEAVRNISKGGFSPVGIVSIDIDGLKLVNDQYGHLSGDALLVAASKIIRSSFRKNDIVVRIGGDEFIIIMPSSEKAAVEQACLRIKAQIESYNKADPPFPLSMSVGGSITDRHDPKSINDAVKEADSRMYAEKKINHKNYRQLFAHRHLS